MKQHWEVTDPKFESDRLNPALSVSPWCGHRNFVYDLLNFLEPASVIELGTHYGCSFFAMCQSIKDHHLSDCHLYAVDTWKGDEQAGFYDESVWELVNETKSRYFETVNASLLRMFFDEAALKFRDGMFDIIHIDGLHTYEAVSHDFSIWLPKLCENGIMLFHDIASVKKYGSNRFWEELKQQYPYHFEFEHSWGLGILFPKGERSFQLFKQENFQDKLPLYHYKARYEYRSLEVRDLTAMADERFEAICQQGKMIAERDATIKGQSKLAEERYQAIQKQSEMISDRDETITAQGKLLEERYEAIQEQSRMIAERDETITAQAGLVEERYQVIQNQSEMIAQRDDAIAAQAGLLEERHQAIQGQSKMIMQRDEAIAAQAELLKERYQAIQEQSRMIAERDEVIMAQAGLLEERYQAIQTQSKMIAERDEAIAAQAELLEERYRVIEQQGRMIKERDHTIEEIEEQVPILKAELQKNTQLIAGYQADQKKMECDYSTLKQEYSHLLSFIHSSWYVRKKWAKYAMPKEENK